MLRELAVRIYICTCACVSLLEGLAVYLMLELCVAMCTAVLQYVTVCCGVCAVCACGVLRCVRVYLG